VGGAAAVHPIASMGFMADARRAYPARGVPEQPRHPPTVNEWQVVSKRKQWPRVLNQLPPPPPCRPVPADPVGHYLNCLRLNHVAAVCPNASRCLCCRDKGHHQAAYGTDASVVPPPLTATTIGDPQPWDG
jgi:hypothetical protein